MALSGCAIGADPQLGATALLGEIETRCVHGMTRLSAAPVVARESASLPFSIADASRCLRVAATGDLAVGGWSVRIEDAEHRIVEQAQAQGRVALVGPMGPTCLERAGSYRVTAQVTLGTGEVALMAWQAE